MKTISGAWAPNFIRRTNGQSNCSKRLAYYTMLAFVATSFHAVSLRAQTAVLPSPGHSWATITFSNGASITIPSNNPENFRLVGILPGETVNIQLQLPPSFANTFVAVQALDGGLISGDVTVAADGTAAIAFQGGVQPGLYRILLSALGKSAMLQFSVSAP